MLELTIERFTDSKISPIDGSLTLHWAKLSSNQGESFNLCQILGHNLFANCFQYNLGHSGVFSPISIFLSFTKYYFEGPMKKIPCVLIQKKQIRIVIKCVITQKIQIRIIIIMCNNTAEIDKNYFLCNNTSEIGKNYYFV